MSDKNLNDFFGEELEKQEEQQKRQANAQAVGFGAANSDDDGRREMFINAGMYDSQQKYTSRKSKGKKAFLIAVGAVVLAVVFMLGYLTYSLANPDLMFIKNVLDLVNENAYIWDESEDKYQHDYAYQAAKAILESVDQYSTLLTPEEYYQLMNPQVSYEASLGVGLSLGKDGYFLSEVKVGSPAYQAGYMMFDVINAVTVEGSVPEGLVSGTTYPVTVSTDMDEFVKYMSAERVSLTVTRDGKSVVLPFISKANYNSSEIEYYFGANFSNMSEPYKQRINASSLPNNVGYIRVTSFMNNDVVEEMESAMRIFKTNGKTKLILDLCGNTGGLDTAAEGVGSYLLYDKNNASSDNIVMAVCRNNKDKVVSQMSCKSLYGDYFDKSSSKTQIVVLTDGYSASASELLLGSLLDYGTAVQVGTTTYGKGIAQGVILLKSAQANIDGQLVDSYWAAYMTYVKYYTPVSDFCPHGVGFTPSAQNTADTYQQKMSRAVEILS